MLTVFRTHPLIHVSYLLALIPGVVLLANGAASITILVIYGGIVAFAHSNTRLEFRAARTGLCESELSPHPPPIGRTTGRQPGLRPDDLGSDLPSRRVPERSDRQDRHGVAGSTADRRASRHGAPAALRGSRGSAGGAVPPDAPAGRSPRRSNRSPSGSEGSDGQPRGCGQPPDCPECRWGSRRHGDGDSRDAPALGSGAVGDGGQHPRRAPPPSTGLCSPPASRWPGSSSTTEQGSSSGRSTVRAFIGTALYFSQTAHLHPGGLFAVLGGADRVRRRNRTRPRSLSRALPASPSSGTW